MDVRLVTIIDCEKCKMKNCLKLQETNGTRHLETLAGRFVRGDRRIQTGPQRHQGILPASRGLAEGRELQDERARRLDLR